MDNADIARGVIERHETDATGRRPGPIVVIWTDGHGVQQELLHEATTIQAKEHLENRGVNPCSPDSSWALAYQAGSEVRTQGVMRLRQEAAQQLERHLGY